MERDLILDVRGLSVSFGTSRILSDLSFTVRRGQSVALVGPNGSGKTVLLRTLLGLVPHDGTVAWAAGVRIGYVPQTLTVDRDLPFTVAEFFACKGISRARTLDLLDRLGLGGDHSDPGHARGHITSHVLPQRLGTLSGGQLQRILIAWALAGDPTVLLFDEPTSGIDVGGQQSVYAMLAALQKERDLTILMISHDLDVVYSSADHVLCINRQLVCHGPPKIALDTETVRKLYGTDVGIASHATRHDH